jgi:membrane-bound inhibitor of C-type lysozyme
LLPIIIHHVQQTQAKARGSKDYKIVCYTCSHQQFQVQIEEVSDLLLSLVLKNYFSYSLPNLHHPALYLQ